MLCDTCMYSCREGYCGIGKGRPHDNYCGDHELGDRAAVPPQIQTPSPWGHYSDPRPSEPTWVSYLRRLPLTDQLPGLPFTVRGQLGYHCGPIPCGPLSQRYALVLREPSYSALGEGYRRGTYSDGHRLYFDYQYHEVHIWCLPDTPVMVAVAYGQTAADPRYVPDRLRHYDIGQYLWWTGWDVATWRVEAFLEGLVLLHTTHLRSEVAYNPPPRMAVAPCEVPLRVNVYTRLVPPEEVYNRLLDQYMTDTRDIFRVGSQSEIHEYLERWRLVLWSHSHP